MSDLTYDEILARIEKLEEDFEKNLMELPGVDYALAVRCTDPISDNEQDSSTISEDNETAAQLINALFDTVRGDEMTLDQYVDFAIDVLINVGLSEPHFLDMLQRRLPEAIQSVNEMHTLAEMRDDDDDEEDED